MNAQPNNPQAVVYNISNTNGNNYVNHAITATTPEAARAECPTEHAESQKKARAPPLPPLDAQHNFTRLTDTSHANSSNLTGFDQGNIVLVGNVGVVSCRGTPPNDMSSADMQTCLGNVGNVIQTCRQILSSGQCQTT